MVKAAALAGLSIYALVSAVGEILAGGRDIDVGWALLYGIVASVAGAVASLILRRRARAGGSDLVRAGGGRVGGRRLLSVAVLAGFVVALVLEQTGRSGLARYIDPAMVALVSAAFLPVPAELVVCGFRELLMTSPGPQLQARIAP